MEKTEGAVNQQGTLTEEAQLGWLGGIVDGEGSITVLITNRASENHNGFNLGPRICITNSNMLIIERAIEILKNHNVGAYVYNNKEPKKTPTRHPCKTITVCGWKRVHTALAVIIPYLVGKQQQARWLLELCESRLNRGVKVGKNIPYSEHEKELTDAIRTSNRTPQRLYASPVWPKTVMI